jgi:SNF2 family DNA or RNA helicase
MNMMKIEGDWLFLQFRWDEKKITKVKELAYDYGVRGAWMPEKKQWKLPAHAAAIAAMEFPDMGRCEKSEAILNNFLKKVARARKAQGKPISFEVEGRVLYSHQMDAAIYLSWGGRILAHDMGLGKTLTSLVAARHMLRSDAADHVIVIAPANTHIDWHAEIQRVGVNNNTSIHSWAKIPSEFYHATDYVLILDEAHYAQTLNSQRTQAVLKLALSQQCIACWCLTGTPMRNGKPVNLYPLLLAVGSPIARNRRRFEKRYCAAKATRFTKWDTTGASNQEELKERTAQFVLRKRKEECIDLPEKVRVVHQCEVSKNTKDLYWRVFEHVYSKFLENIEIEMMELADREPDLTESDLAEYRKHKLKAKAVAQLNAIRQAASRAKIEEACIIAEDAIEEGRRVIIFAEFQETVTSIYSEMIQRKATAVAYHGGLTQGVRNANYQAWKDGDADVFVATPDSGGLGLNLQEASVIIMVDRSYSPGDVEQAEDRAHRIGTKWPVTVYWLQAFPVDLVVDEMLLDKNGNIETVIEGEKLSDWDVLRKLFEEREDMPEG